MCLWKRSQHADNAVDSHEQDGLDVGQLVVSGAHDKGAMAKAVHKMAQVVFSNNLPNIKKADKRERPLSPVETMGPLPHLEARALLIIRGIGVFAAHEKVEVVLSPLWRRARIQSCSLETTSQSKHTKNVSSSRTSIAVIQVALMSRASSSISPSCQAQGCRSC